MKEFDLRNSATQTNADRDYATGMEELFLDSAGSVGDKLDNFARFVSRQSLSVFLAKNELMKMALPVHGSIVECGVFMGGGMFTWAQLSAIYEPVNHTRKVIGFDTFQGHAAISERDDAKGPGVSDEHKQEGSYKFSHLEELKQSVRLFDLNRAIGHIEKVELVPGDATVTIPRHIEDNPHLVVSLLYLDFDLFEPTRVALECLLPRMPKGAVIGFDELNQKQWPGETLAVMEQVGLGKLRIRRFSYTPALSYAIIE